MGFGLCFILRLNGGIRRGRGRIVIRAFILGIGGGEKWVYGVLILPSRYVGAIHHLVVCAHHGLAVFNTIQDQAIVPSLPFLFNHIDLTLDALM